MLKGFFDKAKYVFSKTTPKQWAIILAVWILDSILFFYYFSWWTVAIGKDYYPPWLDFLVISVLAIFVILYHYVVWWKPTGNKWPTLALKVNIIIALLAVIYLIFVPH